MKFSEKLQNLRKEAKLSQEQLASMLDVSRQAVSKWESGQTYPEMDKLIELTKIFKCSLDDLTNDEVKNVGVSKSKNYIDSIVDEALEILDKSVNTFKKLSPNQIFKYIIIFIAIILLITLTFKIPFNYLNNLGYELFEKLGTAGTVMNGIWSFILGLSYFIIIMFTLIYLYKTRFLDKCENLPLKETEEVIEKKIEETEAHLVVKPKKTQRYVLIDFFASVIIFFIKFFASIIIIPLIFTLFALFVAVYIVIFFMVNGVISIGALLVIIFSITLCGLFIDLLFKFVFNKKNNFYVAFVTFIIAIAGFGLASGILVTEISNYNFVNEAPKVHYITDSVELKFKDNLIINSDYYNQDYIYVPTEENKDKIIIEYSFYDDYVRVNVDEKDNKINIESYMKNNSFGKKEVKMLIDNLKDKKIYNYSLLNDIKIKIYTSAANIDKLNENYEEYLSDIEEYEETFSGYENRINGLETRNYELQNQIDLLKEKNSELNSKIEEFKNRINELLNI